MSSRRLLLCLAAVATLATVVLALVGQIGLAVAALSVAIAAMFGWLVLWARRMNGSVGRIEERVARDGAPRSATDAVRADVATLSRQLDQVRVDQGRQADRAYRQTADLASLVQRTPSLTTELGRVTQRLVRHDRPMPELGGWAMTPSTLIWILDLIGTGRVSRILECGSGSSTVWFALALEQRGGQGRVVSLESSPTYAEETRRRLAELDLGERADVLTAELVDLELPGRPPQPWFDASVLPADAVGMDLLFVDGPVGSIAPEARYPALPVLGHRLAADGLVVLDDSARGDEQRIIEQWSSQDVDGRRYEVFRELDRATAFRPV